MSVAVIEAENVSKQFVLSGHRASDLRERLGTLFKRRGEAPPAEPFYALRDIGFSVGRGESVGIVGHNGSGKSTLLKMLSGILKSDTGFIRTTGRIGALIEVGAGFHPDLSGRENVFLNGSIMGLSRRELSSKFDAIVAFSGLEKFIDTPVKRYSSGMFMRLGFAIATHVDPEILLIDEVLAVGDTQFQNKCIKHLRDFSANGGTVVFVSHSMGQVADLCERCLWLDRGRLLHDGATAAAVDNYMALVAEREEEELRTSDPLAWEAREQIRRAEREAREREQAAQAAREAAAREAYETQQADPRRGRILSVRFENETGKAQTVLAAGNAAQVAITYRYDVAPNKPVIALDFFRTDDGDKHAFTTSNYDTGETLPAAPGTVTATLQLQNLALMAGEYRAQVKVFRDSSVDGWSAAPDDTQAEAFGFTVTAPVRSPGVVYMPSRWHVETVASDNGAKVI